jgi:hypothetical protein
MNRQVKSFLALASCAAFASLTGCIGNKKEVVEKSEPPVVVVHDRDANGNRVTHEKTIETERPAVEKERTIERTP